MPPRRRQPMPGSNAPRRSERLRVLREARAASLANTTPNSIDVHRRARREAAAASPPFPPRGSADNATNMPLAGASRSINPSILRRRDSSDIYRDRLASRETVASSEGTPDNATNEPINVAMLQLIRRDSFDMYRDRLASRETAATTPEGSPLSADDPAAPSAIRWSIPTRVSVSPRRSGPDPPTSGTRSAAMRRLQRELQNFLQEPPEGCKAEVVNDNVFHWRATISGPAETPYEGGQFDLDMHFSSDYPFSPPNIHFLTKIFHCNIESTGFGYICLNILGRDWSPALSVAKTLMSITSLLADPNPDDPLEPNIALMYKRQRDQHDQIARTWTNQYAKPM